MRAQETRNNNMGINERTKLSDKEFLIIIIDEFIRKHENIIYENNVLLKNKTSGVLPFWQGRMESAYKYAYWMNLQYIIKYEELDALDRLHGWVFVGASTGNTVDGIVRETIIPQLLLTEKFIESAKKSVEELKSQNPPMRLKIKSSEANTTINLKELDKQPSIDEIDSWRADEESQINIQLKLRNELLRMLYVLQEKHGCTLTYSPVDFGNESESLK